MSKRLDVVVLDVLMKNESCRAEIMRSMQMYLGDNYPPTSKITSGGDQLTCERQIGSQSHHMNGDNPRDRLELLDPQTKDWHGMVCLLTGVDFTCQYFHSLIFISFQGYLEIPVWTHIMRTCHFRLFQVCSQPHSC